MISENPKLVRRHRAGKSDGLRGLRSNLQARVGMELDMAAVVAKLEEELSKEIEKDGTKES